MTERSLTRRSLLRLAALGSVGSVLAACTPSPSAQPTAAPAKPTVAPVTSAPAKPSAAASPAANGHATMHTAPKPGWEEELNKVVAAAKAEKTVAVAGPPARELQEAIEGFTKTYPGITMEYTGGSGGTHGTRMLAEQSAGQFLVDAYVGGYASSFTTLVPANALSPIEDALIIPEVLLDTNWVRGFDYGFMDAGKKFVYAFEATVKPAIWVNRDIVPDSELSKLSQLTDPKWAGKVAWLDPRNGSKGAADPGHLYAVMGEDWLRKVWANDPRISDQDRQIAEWLVRGTYPVAVGLVLSDLTPFQEQGLGKNIKGLDMDGPGARLTPSWGALNMPVNPPHPNAAKLFANWILSKEGQSLWAPADKGNSRRTDVEGPPDSAPTAQMSWTNDEPNASFQDNAEKLSKEVLQ